MQQTILTAENNYEALEKWMKSKKRIFLVCGRSVSKQEFLSRKLDEADVPVIRFSDYQPNPRYESVVKGVELFRNECCDAIIAVGGGSPIDVAKCIKLFNNMEGDGKDGSFLKQTIMPNDIPFLVIPTTAGTGSEATRYAVIYYEGKKQSVTHVSCIPDTVLMDPDCLKALPLYQKKATMMDAFCHALESFWSVNSTEESKQYSREAIRSVLENMDAYLTNDEKALREMLFASNTAGKAINITQTTAGHAMCYKITSLFGASHGHAAILCNRVLFPRMIRDVDKCIDPRGKEYLKDTLQDIADTMGCETPEQAAEKVNDIFSRLEFEIPAASEAQFDELKTSVNPVRLKNHPVAMDEDTINELYHEILRECNEG